MNDKLKKINGLAKVGQTLCEKHECHDVVNFFKEIEKLSVISISEILEIVHRANVDNHNHNGYELQGDGFELSLAVHLKQLLYQSTEEKTTEKE